MVVFLSPIRMPKPSVVGNSSRRTRAARGKRFDDSRQVGRDVVTDCPTLLTLPAIQNRVGFAEVEHLAWHLTPDCRCFYFGPQR